MKDLANQYGVGSMPMTLLFGRDGKIAATYTGMVDRNACEGEIRTLLQARARWFFLRDASDLSVSRFRRSSSGSSIGVSRMKGFPRSF